jgi:cytochrome b
MGGAAATQNAGGSAPPATVKVWDPFVRLFHWCLVALVVIAFLTSDEAVLIHVAVGYAIVGLVAARILWGFIGTRRARFTDFVKSPAETLRYGAQTLLGKSPRYLGHNPLGGAMIVALLAMLLTICGGGYLLSTDAYWGDETLKDLHEATAYLLLVMVVLHLSGVVWAAFAHRENLVKAMFTGRKPA